MDLARIGARLFAALAAVILVAGCEDEGSPTGTATKLPPADVEPPVVSVGPLDPDQTSFRFDVPVTAFDGLSGVASFELWSVTEWGDTTLVGNYTESPVAFHADTSGAHSFFAVATDQAGNRSLPPRRPSAHTRVPDRVVIVDVMDEHYDITHAVRKYNLHSFGWGHGMGRRAFAPINFPQLTYPGEPGYPGPLRTFDTIGVFFGPGARAYPIGEIVAREVVNDTISGVHFAATY